MTLDLQAIRERVNKATLGPWVYRAPNIYADGVFIGEIHMDFDEDRDLLIHACEDVPKLLDEIEQQKQAYIEVNQVADELASRLSVCGREIERLRHVLENILYRRYVVERDEYLEDAVERVARQALEGDTDA